jgi:hypothetical protein
MRKRPQLFLALAARLQSLLPTEGEVMKKTFASEDKRKDKLWIGWIDLLREIHMRVNTEEMQEFYEGSVTISDFTRDRISFKLSEGRRLVREIFITPQIAATTDISDMMYVILGRQKDKWFILDVISIASFVDKDRGEFHFSMNPLHMGNAPQTSAPLSKPTMN